MAETSRNKAVEHRIENQAAGFSAFKYRVLVADDMATMHQLVKSILPRDQYEIIEAKDGEEALAILNAQHFDVVLLDIMMPKKDGYEVLQQARGIFPLLPIIMVTTLDEIENLQKAFALGATDYITKPFISQELLARVGAHAKHKRAVDSLDDVTSILFALARLVEARDGDTGKHCDRLGHYAIVFGKKLGLGYDEVRTLCNGAILHDIGKLAIPDNILLKPGKLEKSEWQVMQQHPVIGFQLCRPLKTLEGTIDIIQSHHEKWNGTGYPQKLKGEDIPYLARVFQIIDIYDALMSKRPYKEAFSRQESMRIMKEETAKGELDPELAKQFFDILEHQPEVLENVSAAFDGGAHIFDQMRDDGVMSWIKSARDKVGQKG